MRDIKNNFSGINKKAVRSVIIGVVLSCAIIIILILLTALLLLLAGKYPGNLINYIVLAILGVGGLSGGYIAARLNKSSGLIIGLASGFALYLIILISGLATSFSTITMMVLYKLIILLTAGALGGILGVNKKDKLRIK